MKITSATGLSAKTRETASFKMKLLNATALLPFSGDFVKNILAMILIAEITEIVLLNLVMLNALVTIHIKGSLSANLLKTTVYGLFLLHISD